jgi:hypothetical protein
MNDRKTPSSVNTQRLDSFMKGEAMTALTGDDGAHVLSMLELAKPRFAPRGLWTIGALSIRDLKPSGRQELKRAFSLFKREQGEQVIVITAKDHVANLFKSVAEETKLSISIADSIPEATRLGNEFRQARAKKEREKNG